MTDVVERILNTQMSDAELTDITAELLEEALSGNKDILDATNPFVLSLEQGAAMAAAVVLDSEQSTLQMYSKMAQEWNDLYYHMSDKDYLGMFGNYSTADFLLSFSRDEIYAKAVKVGETGVRKLILPKYTTVKVADIPFTLLYPIEFRVMSHGGLQIVYDTEVKSPIETKESNLVESRVTRIEDRDYITIRIPLCQVDRVVYSDTLNPSTGFKKDYQFTDQYHYCVVNMVYADGRRVPMSITHSEVIYDALKPTALVKYLGDRINVEVPYIYFTNRVVPNKIEIELYTTKGDINLNMDDYIANAFVLTYGEGLSVPSDTIYSAPFDTWSAIRVSGLGMATGGSNAISFAKQRDRVVNQAGKFNIPITEPQLETKLEIQNYDVILSIDDVMRRVYLGTRYLPANKDSGFYNGAGCMMGTLQATMGSLTLHSGVKDNGERITLSPSILYQQIDGVIKPVADSENPLNQNLSLDVLASVVNRNNYVYTPFHYVLDSTRNAFECRAYLLDKPSVVNRTFVLENDTTQLAVTTSLFDFKREDGNYVLYIQVKSGETYKSLPVETLFAQLSYVPKRETSPVFINGELVGKSEGDAVWQFTIETNLDIDAEQLLYLKNFSMYANQVRDFNCLLEQQFNLIYGVSDYDVYGMVKSEIDMNLGRHLLPESAIGVTHETITLSFGANMDLLWSNGRTVMGSERYKVYPEDVIEVYDAVEYVENPLTGMPKFTINDQGEVEYEILHQIGDPVINPVTGLPNVLHPAGSVIYEDGQPIIDEPRETERQMDLFFVDGIYYFTTYERDTKYRDTIASTVFGFVNDLRRLDPVLHEQTDIFFYPKKSLGLGRLVIGNGRVVEVDTALAFTFRVYLDEVAYANLELRDKIKSTISEVVNLSLKNATVSVDEILETLRGRLKEDIKGVDMDRMTTTRDVPLFTAIDDATRCSVKRIVKVMPSGALRAEEDITVDFLRHSIKQA